jgi:hypothetical protein
MNELVQHRRAGGFQLLAQAVEVGGVLLHDEVEEVLGDGARVALLARGPVAVLGRDAHAGVQLVEVGKVALPSAARPR